MARARTRGAGLWPPLLTRTLTRPWRLSLGLTTRGPPALSPAVPSHRNCSSFPRSSACTMAHDALPASPVRLPRAARDRRPPTSPMVLGDCPRPVHHTVGHDSSVVHIADNKGSTTAATKKLHPYSNEALFFCAARGAVIELGAANLTVCRCGHCYCYLCRSTMFKDDEKENEKGEKLKETKTAE
ncbi:hypothetical protein ZWY2020_021293 [Hordeum vulgare]|nr:hypothetical protein ZWY2020_021293 [Hordeum vulgare]